MKKVYLNLVFVLISISIFGQIVSDQNKWNYLRVDLLTCFGVVDCSGMVFTNHYYWLGNEYIFNEKTYRIVKDSTTFLTLSGTDYQVTEAGYIREDVENKKVYFFQPNSYTTEYIIYDFSLKLDSVFTSTKIYFPPGGEPSTSDTIFQGKVVLADTVEYNGIRRYRLRFDQYSNRWNGTDIIQDTIEWIEGIGAKQDLLNYANVASNLLCFKQNNVLLYSNKYGFECDYKGILTSLSQINVADIEIYPNPSTERIITLKSPKPLNSVELYNLDGRKIRSVKFDSESYQVDLTDFTSGIYLIKIGKTVRKIVLQ